MNPELSIRTAEEIAATRYDFEQLRVRLGVHGKPLPERTARGFSQRIDRIKQGRNWIWTEAAVQRYEQRRTLIAA
jgi:hypothetical protein